MISMVKLKSFTKLHLLIVVTRSPFLDERKKLERVREMKFNK